MKVHPKILLPVLLSLGMSVAGCLRPEEEVVLQVDSQALPNTVITSHMEENIVPGKNLIYCATFQLAWNELRDDIIKEDIRLTDEPPMVKILNKKVVTKNDLSDDCYVALAGFGRDRILERINEALRLKFQDQAPIVEEYLEPGWIFAYAFLLKDLMFEVPFESLKEPVHFGSGANAAEVSAFGIREFQPENSRHAQLAKQVSILHHDFLTNEFVVSLTSTSPNDEIILARVEPLPTLLETVRAVKDTIESASSESLGHDDTLRIPKLDFDIMHSYAELLDKFLLNEGFTSYWIQKARQDIRFRLNEKGAMLKSEARIGGGEIRRSMVFDKPFLLYLSEKDSENPYLAIWVDNPEILLKR